MKYLIAYLIVSIICEAIFFFSNWEKFKEKFSDMSAFKNFKLLMQENNINERKVTTPVFIVVGILFMVAAPFQFPFDLFKKTKWEAFRFSKKELQREMPEITNEQVLEAITKEESQNKPEAEEEVSDQSEIDTKNIARIAQVAIDKAIDIKTLDEAINCLEVLTNRMYYRDSGILIRWELVHKLTVNLEKIKSDINQKHGNK